MSPRVLVPALFVAAVVLAAALSYPLVINQKGKTAAVADRIRLTSPKVGAEVGSPLHIEGVARGSWYFEATFPVTLLDGEGKVLAETYATALGDWMTTEFVPFSATIPFSADGARDGTLVLSRSNPSGLEQNAQELRVPLRFR